MIQCPACDAETRVTETRCSALTGHQAVRRRRRCVRCAWRGTSYELLVDTDDTPLAVVRADAIVAIGELHDYVTRTLRSLDPLPLTTQKKEPPDDR